MQALGILSLVFGVLSIPLVLIPGAGPFVAGVCGLVSAVLGITRLGMASPAEIPGHGLATGGLVCGLVGIGLAVVLVVYGVLFANLFTGQALGSMPPARRIHHPDLQHDAPGKHITHPDLSDPPGRVITHPDLKRDAPGRPITHPDLKRDAPGRVIEIR